MKAIRNILNIVTVLVLASCTQDRIGADQPEGTPVRLSAVISSLDETIVTKAQVTASAYKETVPTEANPLAADLYFSSTQNSFPSETAVHRTITYSSDAFTFPDAIDSQLYEYDTNGATCYCVGFAPQSWGLTLNGSTATSKAGLVDGVTDYMFAPELSGSKTTKFSVQTFNHTLTWIKVRVRAKTASAPVTWGKLHKISIKSKDQAVIDFSDGSISWQNSGDKPVDIVAYEDTLGIDIPTESAEYGSVFVAPVADAGGATLQFSITTDLWGGSGDVQTNPKTATVHLLDNSGNAVTTSTAGQLYVVTLIFTDLATVDATATLEEWTEDNRDSYSAQAEFANVNVTDGSTSESEDIEVITAPDTVTASIVSSNANIGCSAVNNAGSIHVKIYDNGAAVDDTATVTLSLKKGTEIYYTKIYTVTVVASQTE